MKLTIRDAMRRNNMTQTALADAVGVNKSFMSEIISGKKNPSMETLTRIIEALGVTPDEIMLDASDAKPPPLLRSPIPNENNTAGFFEDQTRPWQGAAPGFTDNVNVSGLRHPIHYELLRPSPSLSLLAGDVLTVDIGTKPQAGDLILVGLMNPTGTQVATLVRRFMPPFAVTADPNEPQPFLELDKDGLASWRGTVKSMFRPKM